MNFMQNAEKNKNPIPSVVIFGRANAGKSTLFNRLVEKRQAIISDIAGTTRDSNIGKIFWRGLNFEIIDTGGIIDFKNLSGHADDGGGISVKVQKQAIRHLKNAGLVLFLVDNKTGLLPQDKQMAFFVKKNVDPAKTLLVVNKVDAPKDRMKIAEFHKLSLGEPLPVSAANGSGTGDLLDVIVKKFTGRWKHAAALAEEPEEETRICIIGKPNTGKSCLLNSILGYERVIVSPEPHTTREPQHTKIIYKNKSILLVDTAGISRKAKQTCGLEKLGAAKSLNSLAKSHVALMTLDISENITHQDAKLVEEIINAKKSFIFIANKWDKIKNRDTKKYSEYIYGKLPFARFAPILFVSALTGEKTKKILDSALQIAEHRKLTISDSQLAEFLPRIIKTHRPSKGKGVRHPRIREFRQIQSNPPEFEIKIGIKEDLHFSYVRFIENRLRETYGFTGSPISIIVSKKI